MAIWAMSRTKPLGSLVDSFVSTGTAAESPSVPRAWQATARTRGIGVACAAEETATTASVAWSVVEDLDGPSPHVAARVDGQRGDAREARERVDPAGGGQRRQLHAGVGVGEAHRERPRAIVVQASERAGGGRAHAGVAVTPKGRRARGDARGQEELAQRVGRVRPTDGVRAGLQGLERLLVDLARTEDAEDAAT